MPHAIKALAAYCFLAVVEGKESEPNDSVALANPLAAMPAHDPQAIEGRVSHALDFDTFEVFITEPCLLDVRVVTGAALFSLHEHGASGGGVDPVFTPSFYPVLRFYGPSGRLLHEHVSAAPNLLMLDLPVPLLGESLFLELSAYPGTLGKYGLQVNAEPLFPAAAELDDTKAGATPLETFGCAELAGSLDVDWWRLRRNHTGAPTLYVDTGSGCHCACVKGQPFTVSLEAYDVAGTLLLSHTAAGPGLAIIPLPGLPMGDPVHLRVTAPAFAGVPSPYRMLVF